MKAILLSIFLIACSCFKLTAQDSLKTKNSELCIEKGKFVIDAFYGMPYLTGSVIKTVLDNSTGSTVASISNLNHIGGKFEYMINDNIGLGLEYTYAAVSAKYNYVRNYTNNNQNFTVLESYNAKLTKQRLLVRVNFHFNTTEKLDVYGTAGLGYKKSQLKTDNLYNTLEVISFNTSINLVPISIRGGIGMRYFFTQNIGINAELGIGGPLIQAGLTGKF
jgi:opacity protein-like surface antigen